MKESNTKKFIYFPLWKIDELEKTLEEMEKQGYRTVYVKNSYWFYFKKSRPKEVSYFLSYISPRGQNMMSCDYAISSNHKGHPVNNKSSYYKLFRTTELKSELVLLYGIRDDFIKHVFLQKIFISLFMLLLLSLVTFAGIMTTKNFTTLNIVEIAFVLLCITLCLFFSVYYLYGYLKQCKKIKQWKGNHGK